MDALQETQLELLQQTSCDEAPLQLSKLAPLARAISPTMHPTPRITVDACRTLRPMRGPRALRLADDEFDEEFVEEKDSPTVKMRILPDGAAESLPSSNRCLSVFGSCTLLIGTILLMVSGVHIMV